MIQDNISSLEKRIYNTYLKISKTKQNKPYRYRKDFSKFESDKNYVYVKRLHLFFKKFPHIDIETFMQAPYFVYPDPEPYYDLQFYTSPRAIRVFGSYNKMLDDQDPDSPSQIARVKDSLMFIYTFCRDNNILVDDYLDHVTGDVNTFIIHLRDRHISVYALFGFENIDRMMSILPADRLEFTIGKEFVNKLANFKTRYYNSIKIKSITTQGLEYIKQLIQESKKQTNK